MSLQYTSTPPVGMTHINGVWACPAARCFSTVAPFRCQHTVASPTKVTEAPPTAEAPFASVPPSGMTHRGDVWVCRAGVCASRVGPFYCAHASASTSPANFDELLATVRRAASEAAAPLRSCWSPAPGPHRVSTAEARTMGRDLGHVLAAELRAAHDRVIAAQRQ
jgi:hypothetical protein